MTKIKDGEIVDYVKDIHIPDPLLASPADVKEAPKAKALKAEKAVAEPQDLPPMFVNSTPKKEPIHTTVVVDDLKGPLFTSAVLTDEPLPEEAEVEAGFEPLVLDDAAPAVQRELLESSLTPEAKEKMEQVKAARATEAALAQYVAKELKKQSNGINAKLFHIRTALETKLGTFLSLDEDDQTAGIKGQIKALQYAIDLINKERV